MTGKIIKGIAGFYYVNDGENRVYQCRAKGIFRNRKIKPLVGDNVEFSILDEEAGEGNIDEILPRKNALVRPAAANVDQALVLFALTQPSPNLNLLDRFLVMMAMEEIPVVICFNKADLGDGAMEEEYKKIYEGAGYEVHFISARTDLGMDQVRELLRGRTTVLAGPSGVGKSSLTNRIQPEASMETGGISRKIERGKHTTRHSELFFVEKDTYMMDTPGFSSLQLPEDLTRETLCKLFPEMMPYLGECRFATCLHDSEPDCAVKEAVAQGKLSASRYEHYLELLKEVIEQERRY